MTDEMDERKLTEEQIKYVNSNSKCPLCHAGELIGGPEGGCSVNFKCTNCSQEYWMGIAMGSVHFGGLIDRDAPEYYGPPEQFKHNERVISCPNPNPKRILSLVPMLKKLVSAFTPR